MTDKAPVRQGQVWVDFTMTRGLQGGVSVPMEGAFSFSLVLPCLSIFLMPGPSLSFSAGAIRLA